jgi:uncharacterized protein (DUF1501 family)
MPHMHRRHFLKLSTMALLGAALSPGRATSEALASRALVGGDPVVIIVELRGGNDGLNTVIPLREPRYAALRPNLGVKASDALRLSPDLGFNPALQPLMGAWDAGELAVALGLGYPEPDRSHFRSAEIWETAAASGEALGADTPEDADMGWGARLLPTRASRPAIDAVILGQDAGLTYQSADLVSMTLSRPAQALRQLRAGAGLGAARGSAVLTGHAALDHILDTQRDLDGATDTLQKALAGAPALAAPFPSGQVGDAFEVAARLIGARLSVSAVHVTVKGFDTHARQRGAHDKLLGGLASALQALRANLIAYGRWQETVLMTCSEFGRRAAENASQGTDHGVAAPHLLMGGLVRGGLYGAQPSLDALDARGDLVPTTDYRLPLHEVASRCWGVGLDPALTPLGMLRG